MARTRDDDACPGALQVHRAADGALARVRLPGGMITAAQLETPGAGSDRLGVRRRWNSPPAATFRSAASATRGHRGGRGRVAGAGLLPSPTHERVRNIVASPLSGRGRDDRRCPRTGRRLGQRDSGAARAGRAAGQVPVRHRRRPRRHLRTGRRRRGSTSSASRRLCCLRAADTGVRLAIPMTRSAHLSRWRDDSPMFAESAGV